MSRLPDWYSQVLGADLRARRLARAELAGVASRVLAPLGLTVTAPAGATQLLVRRGTGRSVTVEDIEGLLDAVATLTGQEADPIPGMPA